jgi:transcriptional regulator with XRE-family HTH domain
MTNTTHANVYPFSADGRELAEWRKAQGLTQDQLGEIIGYSGNAIGNWETGRYMPRSDPVSKLAMLGFRFSRLDRMRAAVTDNPTCDPRRNPSPPAEPAGSVSDGRRLAQWRKAQGLTQNQLAEIIGYSDTAIGHWETGRYIPNSDAMSKLNSLGFTFSLSPNSDYAEHATGDSSQPPKPVAPAPGSVDLSQVAQALELAHAVRNAAPALKTLRRLLELLEPHTTTTGDCQP